MSSCAAHMFIEAHVEGVVADVSRGADSIPKSSQAVRSAQADLPPMRFTVDPSIRRERARPPSSLDGVTCDRQTNGSAPRQSRREAEPQRRLTGWSAALSRRAGVSRDQPPEIQAASSGERPSQKTRALLGVGHGWRPLAEAGTAQRGEWPRSAASSGEPGARGGTPGRGLALPGPDGEFAKKRCPNAHLAKRRRPRQGGGAPAALPDPDAGLARDPRRNGGRPLSADFSANFRASFSAKPQRR